VAVYDRDGANTRFVDGLQAVEGQQRYLRNIVYHNQTIRGMFDPSSKAVYDNNEHSGGLTKVSRHMEVSKGIRWKYQGKRSSSVPLQNSAYLPVYWS
jgi:hypothetical protein